METYNPFSLHGKTIVITGASSGIGRQCAISCSLMGARVILMGRDKVRLQETFSSLDNASQHIQLIVDLNDFIQVEEKFQIMKGQAVKIDGIIHCAGISNTLPLRLISEEKLDSFFRTNVSSAINLTRLLTKPEVISKDGASIIFLASVMGVVGEVGKTLYSLTKGALVTGTKSLALELAPKRIRVNCISPGVVISPMSNQAVYSQDETSVDAIKRNHPLGMGQPEDVANACIYLLSDASKWVTGSNLIVDGGYTAR